MILTVDIGNSIISFALFKDGEIIRVNNFSTPKDLLGTAQENFQFVRPIIDEFKKDNKGITIEKALISSVVPKLNYPMSFLLEEAFNFKPNILLPNPKTCVKLDVDIPESVGSDIVACAVGATKFGRGPYLVIDLGTANKYFYIDDKCVFHGVAISPGVEVSFKGLVKNAAQLYDVELRLPPKVLGRNTPDSLTSGLLYGLLGEMNGFIDLIKEEVGGNPKVLLTGGNAFYIKDAVSRIIKYVPNLVHYGLYGILVNSNEK